MSDDLAKLLLEELRAIRTDIRDLRIAVETHGVEISALKVKAGVWGILGGVLVAAATFVGKVWAG